MKCLWMHFQINLLPLQKRQNKWWQGKRGSCGEPAKGLFTVTMGDGRSRFKRQRAFLTALPEKVHSDERCEWSWWGLWSRWGSRVSLTYAATHSPCIPTSSRVNTQRNVPFIDSLDPELSELGRGILGGCTQYELFNFETSCVSPKGGEGANPHFTPGQESWPAVRKFGNNLRQIKKLKADTETWPKCWKLKFSKLGNSPRMDSFYPTNYGHRNLMNLMQIIRNWRDKTYSGMGKHTGRKSEGVPRRRTLSGFPICIGNFNTQAKIQKIEWASSDWRKNLTMLSAAGRSGQCRSYQDH